MINYITTLKITVREVRVLFEHTGWNNVLVIGKTAVRSSVPWAICVYSHWQTCINNSHLFLLLLTVMERHSSQPILKQTQNSLFRHVAQTSVCIKLYRDILIKQKKLSVIHHKHRQSSIRTNREASHIQYSHSQSLEVTHFPISGEKQSKKKQPKVPK